MKIMRFAAAATVAALCLPTVANAATLVVDVSGSESFAGYFSPENTVATYNIGANSHVVGVSFDVTITAFSPSWLEEATLAFTDSTGLGGVDLTPGIGDDFSGTGSYSGSGSLVDLGLDFNVLADGILRLEYWESFNDGGVSPDAIWQSGTVTFTYELAPGGVPEPSAWALLILGFGLTGGTMRSTRSRTIRQAYS